MKTSPSIITSLNVTRRTRWRVRLTVTLLIALPEFGGCQNTVEFINDA
jgi:hypothetical protein